MNSKELKSELDKEWEISYELEDKVNTTPKDAPEYAGLYQEWADARKRVCELDALLRKALGKPDGKGDAR